MSRFWQLKDFAHSFLGKEQSDKTPQKSLLLPNDIGCRIIEIEMDTIDNQNLTKQIVMDLVSQYNVSLSYPQKAIEFYEQRGSQKYLLYQKKLQNFILRPSVTEVLQGKTGSFLLKKQKNEQQLKKMQLNSHSQVKKLLESSQNSGKKQQEIMNKQLKNQQKDLEERIKRKRASSILAKRSKYTAASFSHSHFYQQDSNRPTDIQMVLSQFVQVSNAVSISNTKLQKKLTY